MGQRSDTASPTPISQGKPKLDRKPLSSAWDRLGPRKQASSSGLPCLGQSLLHLILGPEARHHLLHGLVGHKALPHQLGQGLWEQVCRPWASQTLQFPTWPGIREHQRE